MLIDLNLTGRRALLLGGGREATRKLPGLLNRSGHILLVARSVTPEIRQWADEGRLEVRLEELKDFHLPEPDGFYLVMAMTDDQSLNRKLAERFRPAQGLVYCVDDPEVSDFSHPALAHLKDGVQLAVSTGGRSPLMARVLRERLEARGESLVSDADALMIELQARLRKQAKARLAGPADRRRFLMRVLEDGAVRDLLENRRLDEAETRAWSMLDGD